MQVTCSSKGNAQQHMQNRAQSAHATLLQADLTTGELPSMEALLGRHVDMCAVRKIGEGTFGEAFKARRRSATRLYNLCSQTCWLPSYAKCLVSR